MFQGKNMLCPNGNVAQLVCTDVDCTSYLFICSHSCKCYRSHQPQCPIKDIKLLVNGVQTVLRRNFCKAYKGEGIQVIARVARQTFKAPKNFRFCLTQCKVDEKKTMQFSIRTLKGCVGVGVLHLPTMINHMYQYLPNDDYINHGAYMILSNGYQYSHSRINENFIENSSMNMQEGQSIKLYMQESKLFFQQGCKLVSLSLQPALLDELYYGVYLYDQGDQVQVLAKK